MSDTILLQRDGPIATVVLNRPEKLNALTRSMWQRLGEAIAGLSAEDGIRCIVVRGAGDKAFAPGNDISEFETERANVEQARAYGADMHRTLGGLRAVPPSPGGDDQRHLRRRRPRDRRELRSAHLRQSRAASAHPSTSSGWSWRTQSCADCSALVGRATALEILLEGRVFGAHEAKDKGLVTRIVPDDMVEEETYATARRIADGAPLVARWHKQFAARLADPRPLSEAEIDEGYACFGTEDFRIGYRAFLAKSKPEFKGR